MIIILFTPLQGGGHRFKSCTAHQGNQGVTDLSVTPFSFVHLNLYTLRRESRTALGRSDLEGKESVNRPCIMLFARICQNSRLSSSTAYGSGSILEVHEDVFIDFVTIVEDALVREALR